MSKTDEIYEIALLARVTWNLHSLNNEGTVGNVTEPRTVVLASGVKTDGISGEMLKHIHVAKMWEKAEGDLCEACKILEPARADRCKDVRDSDVTGEAVKIALGNCMICDVHGFLVQKPTVARASTVEFGWALGIPEVYRDIHTHARHAVGEKRAKRKRKEEGEEVKEEEKETTQMVYHRPTRSGVYAVISVFQPWRIGLNNVTYQYNVPDSKRTKRFQVALRAYQDMFLRTDGAMTTTRLPHTERFEGVIVVSSPRTPVPVISPLTDSYIDQIREIAGQRDSIELLEFDSLPSFIRETDKLVERPIYKLAT